MRTVKITRNVLFSNECSLQMLLELAEEYCGYSAEAARKLANAKMAKPSKDLEGLLYAKLRTVVCQKLEGNILHGESFKAGVFCHDFECLEPQQAQQQAQQQQEPQQQQQEPQQEPQQQGPEQAQQEPQQQEPQQQEPQQEPGFGANTRKRGTGTGKAKASTHKGGCPREGAYVVDHMPPSGGSVTGADAGKWEIWQHIWNCRDFAEYFRVCPAKGTKSSGTVISASSEMLYALKMGWVRPL